MKKFLFISALAMLPFAAMADSVTDLKAGTDLVVRAVGGTLSATIGGTTSSAPIPPTFIGKVPKAAGAFAFGIDLFAIAPALGAHTTLTFTGVEPTTNVVHWTITDTPAIGTTINFTIGSSTYAVKITSVSGNFYHLARPATEPIFDPIDNVYRGTDFSNDTSFVSNFTVSGLVSGAIPVSITITPQLSGTAGAAVTVPFVTHTVFNSSSYLTSGTSQTMQIFLDKVAAVATTVGIGYGPGLAGPATASFAVGSQVTTVPITVASGAICQTPSFVRIRAGLYTVDTSATIQPQLFSLSPATAVFVAGGVSTITVNLTTPAPAGGAVIQLRTDNTNDLLPASITIPAGQLHGSFNVLTAIPASSVGGSLIVTASYAGEILRTNFTLH
jgi:hypothetical protein